MFLQLNVATATVIILIAQFSSLKVQNWYSYSEPVPCRREHRMKVYYPHAWLIKWSVLLYQWDIFHMFIWERAHLQCLESGAPCKRTWKVTGRTCCLYHSRQASKISWPVVPPDASEWSWGCTQGVLTPIAAMSSCEQLKPGLCYLLFILKESWLVRSFPNWLKLFQWVVFKISESCQTQNLCNLAALQL